MNLRVALFIALFSFHSISFATVRIINFAGSTYSRADGPFFGNPNATIHTIFGGLSGTCKPELESIGSTCNSCIQDTPDPTAACNTRRVHNNLRFGISIQSDQRGKVLVTNNIDDNQGRLDFYVNGVLNNELIFEANTTIQVYVPWAEICEEVPGIESIDCSSGNPTGSINIRVGVDNVPQGTTGDTIGGGTTTGAADNKLSSGEYVDLQISIGKIATGQTELCINGDAQARQGACNFIAYPGDGKIFLEEVYADQGFPSITGSDASAVALRVFHSTTAYPNINSPDFTDIELKVNSSNAVNSDGVKLVDLTDPIVSGLENGVPHFFAIGVVDETSNVGLVTNMAAAINDKNDKTLCYNGTNDDWPQNCHRAEPAEVIGLIEDEFDCFITTATYGSPFRPKVEDFRAFRNQYLKTNWLGQTIIDFYYKHSPPIASWIRNHPQSKPFVRSLLYPFWIVAKWPLTIFLIFFSLLLIGPVWVFKKRGSR